MTKRSEKVSSEIKHAVANIVRENYQGLFPDVLLTITTVKASDDLREARIFCSFFSKNENSVEDYYRRILKDLKKIRRQLAARIIIKYIPKITFTKDGSLENAEKINRLLRDL